MEVAIRVVPSAPIPLSVELIARLAKVDNSPFSELVDADYFEVPPGIPAPFGPPDSAIRGLMLARHDDGLTVLVQRDLLIAKWRKMNVEPAPAYPRFETMIGCLRDALGMLILEAEMGSFEARVVNMSYTNVENDSRDIEDGQIPFFNFAIQSPELQQAEPKLTELNFAWREDRFDLRLRAHRGAVMKGPDDVTPSFIIFSVCGTEVMEGESFEDLIWDCHNQVNLRFPQLIRPSTLEGWGYASD